MEYFIGILALVWFANIIYKGYSEANKPDLTMRDTGNGILEPICPACSVKLIKVERAGDAGLRNIIGIITAIGGGIAMLSNAIAGIALLILGVIIYQWGKSTVQVLTCPACGTDAKTLQ